MAHKKTRSGKLNTGEGVVKRTQPTKEEKRAGRRNILVLGVFLLLTLSIAGVANWRTFETFKMNSALPAAPNAPMPNVPPALPSNNPAKEFVYAGGSLLATVESFREAPDDFAIWRPGNGIWYILNNQQQMITYQWGIQDDIPSPGDFDGDGKADFSIFRPSNGGWYIVNSSNAASQSFTLGGLANDKPAVADYDGDGRADAAVFQPSSTFWLIKKSSDDSTSTTSFGLSIRHSEIG